jgi:hypothetical protein
MNSKARTGIATAVALGAGVGSARKFFSHALEAAPPRQTI